MIKIVLLSIMLVSCAHFTSSKRAISLPFTGGTPHKIQPAGNTEGSLTFEVPFGTKVTSIDDGKVEMVYTPEGGGGCDKQEYFGKGHHIRILHNDGTLSQYLHITPLVKKGDFVKKGEVIAVTANNGVVCVPNLHFTLYSDVSGKKVIPAKLIE